MVQTAENSFFNLDQRCAGILLHPTSLPGHDDNGDLGHEAYRFIEFLADSGMSLWQMLPLGPTSGGDSPYQCLSAHAGNPNLISLDWLQDRGWLDRDDIDAPVSHQQYRQFCLIAAGDHFHEFADDDYRDNYKTFCNEQSYWLDDYALFMALRYDQNNRAWTQWPAGLRDRDPDEMDSARKRLSETVEQVRFEQYVFYAQWHELKDYAHEHGVYMFGDMPIFVAHDSADVWSHRDYFALDRNGECEIVAGVPPDYFSETGQRWGNPLYRWGRMELDGFQWWIQRMHSQLELFDVIRIDHFRGFEAYWEIPAEDETAVNGCWVKAPGEAFLAALKREFSNLPLVAEDLGVITPEVDALRKKFDLPGMKILQFAFDGSPQNPYLPHNHHHNSVVYTGTHDNDTTVSWFALLAPDQQSNFEEYLGCVIKDDMPWPLIRTAMASVANIAILPMQDVLALDGSHRMNVPGTSEGNWRWRFNWQQVPDDLTVRLHEMVQRYSR
ncbi:MAG: 4-alpha-glucanotransferase [Gammaproteobacteria bacterium]|nr:MAG: 4-alpha-glucanotransferase [Gammaproteobacteria bacterium]